jgi:hypothetical protein
MLPILLFLLSLSQKALAVTMFSPPSVCQSFCHPIAKIVIDCKPATAPSADSEWQSTTLNIAQCICPTIASSVADQCLICLQTNRFGLTSSVTLINQLKPNCAAKNFVRVSNSLLQLYNKGSLAQNDTTTQPITTPTASNAVGLLPLSLVYSLLCLGVFSIQVLI